MGEMGLLHDIFLKFSLSPFYILTKEGWIEIDYDGQKNDCHENLSTQNSLSNWHQRADLFIAVPYYKYHTSTF